MSLEVEDEVESAGASASAELHAEPVGTDGLGNVYSLELKLSGLFIPTERALPIGSVLSLTLTGKGGSRDFKAIGRVVRVVDAASARRQGGRAGMQVEFLDLRARSLAPTPPAEPEASRRSRRQTPTGPARVLVVDDDRLQREQTARAMREAGHEVLTAGNGVEALSLVLGEPVDLVLTDVTMPTMDGWQLLRLIRARPKLAQVPVIFLTRLTSDTERLKAYELGVDDFVDKPVTREDLLLRVGRLLARRRSDIPPDAAEVLRGDLGQVALGSLLSLLDMERRTGILSLLNGAESAVLHLREGAVVRIDLPPRHAGKQALDRFLHVLDFSTGTFELTAVTVVGDDQLGLPTTYVLLEHARRRDEATQARSDPTASREAAK
jgi:DNA-binding response OmpR family regulator